jgi:hypothetical protein
MSVLGSLTQLVKTLQKETSRTETIEENIEKMIAQAITKFKNTYIIEICNGNLEFVFYQKIPKNNKEAEPFLKELKEKFKEHYIIPSNPKGGHLGILGNIEIFYGKLPLSNEKKNKTLEKLKKYIPEENLKKLKEILSQNEGRILIVKKPSAEEIEKIKKMIEEKTRSEKKVKCMLCSSTEYASQEISNVLQWLISKNKNITFVYNHSQSKYYENLPICYKCMELLRGSPLINLDKSFKFLDYKFKVFIQMTEENYDKIKNMWDYFTQIENKCFDDVIELLPTETTLESTWLNILIYKKEMNKVNIIDLIEEIRLRDIVEVYNIFKKWRNENIGMKMIDKNSLLVAIIQKEGEIKLNQDLLLQILNKLLRREKIDKNIYIKIINIFDKLSRRYLYDKDEEQLQKLLKLIDFIEFYNKNI